MQGPNRQPIRRVTPDQVRIRGWTMSTSLATPAGIWAQAVIPDRLRLLPNLCKEQRSPLRADPGMMQQVTRSFGHLTQFHRAFDLVGVGDKTVLLIWFQGKLQACFDGDKMPMVVCFGLPQGIYTEV